MRYFKLLGLISCSLLLAAPAYAISIGETYFLGGDATVYLYLPGGGSQTESITPSSSFTFATNGIFRLDFSTSAGSSFVELGYDINDFNDGGDVTLVRFLTQDAQAITNNLNSGGRYNPALDSDMNGLLSPGDVLRHYNGINDPSSTSLINVGLFHEGNALPQLYSFIALAQNGVFSLNGDQSTLSIMDAQFFSGGQFLGATDFNFHVKSSVPEPATLLLLSGGLLVGLRKKRQFDCD